MTDPHPARRAPRGKWEKAFDGSAWWFGLAGAVLVNLIPGLTLWPRVVVTALVMTAVLAFLYARRQRDRKARLDLDAENLGLIECCLRYPHAAPGSLRKGWTFGTAQLETRRIVFTPILEEDGPPVGAEQHLAIEEFLGHRTPSRPDRPSRRKNDPIVALRTNKGEVEIAAAGDSLKVLKTRVLGADIA
jgi:hypothetical protein